MDLDRGGRHLAPASCSMPPAAATTTRSPTAQDAHSAEAGLWGNC